MEVYYRDNFNKENKIELGDLFIHKDRGEGYILIDVASISEDLLEFPVVLQNLSGEDNYDSFTSTTTFIKDYEKELFDEFDHYPRNKYILELLKKE